MDARRHQALLREIVVILREVIGEDEGWAARITGTTRLDDDLHLDSIELAELAGLVRHHFGDGVDLLGHVCGLDLDQTIALDVADLVALVARTPAERP